MSGASEIRSKYNTQFNAVLRVAKHFGCQIGSLTDVPFMHREHNCKSNLPNELNVITFILKKSVRIALIST